MNARSNASCAVQVELLVIEEDVRSKHREYAGLIHAAKKEGVVDGDAPLAQ